MTTTTIFTNTSLEEDDDGESGIHPYFVTSSLVAFSCILALSTVGNLVFAYVIISSKSSSAPHDSDDVFGFIALKSVTNYLLVNLSIADLLITWLCVPLQMTVLSLRWFPFGRAMCHIISIVQPAAICASSFTLVAICSERYLSILRPLRPRLQNWPAVVILVWVASLVVVIPDVLFTNYKVPEGDPRGKPQCYKEQREEDLLETIYDAAILLLQYLVPVLVMAYTNGMIAFTLWKKREIGEVQSSQLQTRKNQMLKSKRKMIVMLMVVATVYTACYFPINIVWLVLSSTLTLPHSTFGYIHTVFVWLAYSHTFWNPLIYYSMNAKVRQKCRSLAASLPILSWFVSPPKRSREHSQCTTLTSLRQSSFRRVSSQRAPLLHSPISTQLTNLSTNATGSGNELAVEGCGN